MHTGCPRLCQYHGVSPQECSPCPISPSTKPLAHYLTSPPTPHPRFSNVSTVSSPTLWKSLAPHPFLLQIASVTSSCWSLLRMHAADSNSTSMTTSLTHFTTKSSPMHLTTSTSSLAYFHPKHHTLSSDYVKATHTTASLTSISTQASNRNYVSLYIQLPTNQFVHVAPLLIFLVITSSNAHASAKSASTMLFATALPMLWPQFSPLQNLSPQILWLTQNPTFTSHLTLTFVLLTSLLTRTQQRPMWPSG